LCVGGFKPVVPALDPALVGDRVWARRKMLGWTQQELAHHSLINRVTVARIEAGQQMPKLSTLQCLARAMSCPLDSLLK